MYRVSVKALIFDDDKKERFLLISEIEDGIEMWELPGGGLEYGEKPHDCLRREIKEEMDLEVEYIAETPRYFLTAFDKWKNKWKGFLIYETKLVNLNFTPSKECLNAKFFTKEEALKVPLLPSSEKLIEVL